MKPKLTICGLGPGGRDQITAATRSAIAEADVRFLRTGRHPTASAVADATTFDYLYDEADSFAEVYHGIVERLVEAVTEAGTRSVLYAVPGSPLILENSVRRILDDERVDVALLPALSFLDETWARLRIDPVEESVRLVDGHQFSTQAAGERGPLLVAHVHAPWVLSDIKLAIDAGDEQRAVVLQRLGTGEERIFEVAWPDLDRVVEPDHLTSLYLPEVAAPVGYELARTVELMHRLRADCPWDRDQDHVSLRTYLVEESYEVLEAIDSLAAGEEGYEDLEEELGDLWFQILFHAELATEAGQFSIADVARTLYEKMVRRHPHVYGDPAATGDPTDTSFTDTSVASWDRLKQVEKQRTSAFDGVPVALPALALATKLLQRASKAGQDVDLNVAREIVLSALAPGGVLAEAIVANADGEVAHADPPGPVDSLDHDRLGQLLVAVVALGLAQGVAAEDALRDALSAAAARFRSAEQSGSLTEGGSPCWALG